MLMKTKAAVLVLAITLSMCVVFANENAYAAQTVDGIRTGNYRSDEHNLNFYINTDRTWSAVGHFGRGMSVISGTWQAMESMDGPFVVLTPNSASLPLINDPHGHYREGFRIEYAAWDGNARFFQDKGDFANAAPPGAVYDWVSATEQWESAPHLIMNESHDEPAPASAAISVIFNGRPLLMDVPPQIMNGSTMVPVRAITEAFGCEVTWEPTYRTITIEYGVVRNGDWVSIGMSIGSRDVFIVGVDDDFELISKEPNTISSPPVIVENRTLVPLRFIAAAFDLKVDWDDATRTVYISSP